MANTLTPEQFEQACKNAIVSVEKNISKILINATNIGSAEMQFRIFNKGQTVAGNTMRYRSAPYIKKRVKAGRQVAYKDLEFSGDLYFSMAILSTGQKEVVYGFNNNRTAEIAGYQETSSVQVNEPIFDLTEKEAKSMEREFAIDVSKIFTGALEGFPKIPTITGGKSKIRQAKTKRPVNKTKAKSPAKKKAEKLRSANKKKRK
jgi:hypothetical protein